MQNSPHPADQSTPSPATTCCASTRPAPAAERADAAPVTSAQPPQAPTLSELLASAGKGCCGPAPQ